MRIFERSPATAGDASAHANRTAVVYTRRARGLRRIWHLVKKTECAVIRGKCSAIQYRTPTRKNGCRTSAAPWLSGQLRRNIESSPSAVRHGRRDLFDLAPDPQQIPAPDLGDLFFGISPADEL